MNRREEPATDAGRALLVHLDGPHSDTHKHDSIVTEHQQHVDHILAIEREAQGEQPAPLNVEQLRRAMGDHFFALDEQRRKYHCGPGCQDDIASKYARLSIQPSTDES